MNKLKGTYDVHLTKGKTIILDALCFIMCYQYVIVYSQIRININQVSYLGHIPCYDILRYLSSINVGKVK
jgi:hypothetical protein